MLCVPVLKALVVHCAVLLLPLPANETAEQVAMDAPASVKLMLPVGAVPATVAVNVTAEPAVDGLAELASVVVDGAGPSAAVPHASTSVMREKEASAAVTLMRMRLVVYGAKLTLRFTRLLPVTLPSVTHADPFQPCTLNAVTP